MKSITWILSAALLAASIAFVGVMGRGALHDLKGAQRYVTVKGLAEQEVPADLAIWPIRFQVSEDTLTAIQDRIDANTAIVRQFLADAGLPEDAIENAGLDINDRQAQMYGTPDQSKPRYVGAATVLVRSADTALVKSVSGRINELVKRGVPVSGNSGPQYYFTTLNDIKPEMIAAATRNAREAAEQFANDSGSTVGAIRTARQGLFSITPRDDFTPDIKNVRVVTTVDYFLVD